jgi:hypothetical protein
MIVTLQINYCTGNWWSDGVMGVQIQIDFTSGTLRRCSKDKFSSKTFRHRMSAACCNPHFGEELSAQ